MKLFRCDHCKSEAPTTGYPSWYTVDYKNELIGGPEFPKHFCSITCIAKFFLALCK